jgi:hypothetical protein
MDDVGGDMGECTTWKQSKVRAHSSHRIDAVFDHFWVRVGEHVDRLHHRFTEGTVGR